MKKRIGSYPRVRVEGGGRALVSQAGAVLLVETVRKTGLDAAFSAALEPWRKARAVHDRRDSRAFNLPRLRKPPSTPTPKGPPASARTLMNDRG